MRASPLLAPSHGRQVPAAARASTPRRARRGAHRRGGPDTEVALRKHAERFGDVAPGAPLLSTTAPDLARALAGPFPEERTRLERVASRIGRSRWPSEARSVGERAVPAGSRSTGFAPMQRRGVLRARRALSSGPRPVLMTR